MLAIINKDKSNFRHWKGDFITYAHPIVVGLKDTLIIVSYPSSFPSSPSYFDLIASMTCSFGPSPVHVISSSNLAIGGGR